MKQGWLIYDVEGAKRNEWFISECLRLAKDAGLRLSLQVIGRDFCLDSPPDYALMRAIAPDISADLEGAGTRLFNPASVSRLANDKWATAVFGKEIGLPILPTVLSSKAVDGSPFGYPVVVKSRDGHGGSEVFLLSSQEEYIDFFKNHSA